MTRSLKDRIDNMDVDAWRANQEALELERSLKEETDKMRQVLGAGKRTNAENSTDKSDPDDLASYFSVENRD
ncbi:MAG: hypothetical protein VXY23_07870 [Pseudomonadota bacterium]|nr:hypothetical protein [Pseudomonadota bacterium]